MRCSLGGRSRGGTKLGRGSLESMWSMRQYHGGFWRLDLCECELPPANNGEREDILDIFVSWSSLCYYANVALKGVQPRSAMIRGKVRN